MIVDEVDSIFLSRQWELVCVRLGELEAEPPADLTIVTRHENLFDEIVHLVPVVALGRCLSYPLWSHVE